MTMLFSRMLLATDFSPAAAAAQEVAMVLATACRSKLEILSVLEAPSGMDPEYQVNQVYLEQLRKEANKHMDQLTGRATEKGLKVETALVAGIPSRQINERAKKLQSALIVMGTRGKSGLAHALLGSTAEGVMRGAPCPVLTVRAGAQITPHIARVLVPVDFNDCSIEALEYAVQVAKQFRAAVVVLHVVEPASYGLDFTLAAKGDAKKLKEAVTACLEKYTRAIKSQKIAAEPIVHSGTPGESILAVAATKSADLIVLGTHGRKGFTHLVSGSVAEAVVRHAPCPVLTVKSPKFGGLPQRIIPAATPN